MRDAKLLETRSVALTEIDEGTRLRPVSAAGVEALVQSYRELGHFKDAIDLRKVRHQGGKLVLVAGGHRLAAARALGLTEIRADIWDCTDDWASLLEVDDNLAGADLTALDTAVFLAQRKRIYEKLHPETVRGIAGALAKHGAATDTVSVASFAAATAEKLGVSERHVRRMVSAGTKLDARDVALLREAERAVTLADLQEIAKIEQPVTRYDVVEMFSKGKAPSVAAAVKALRAETPKGTKPLDPVDEAFKGLLTAWKRAPVPARRRFAAELADEIIELQGDNVTPIAPMFKRGGAA